MINTAAEHFRVDIFYLSIITIVFVCILLLTALLTFKKPAGIEHTDKSIQRGIEIAWALIPLVMIAVMLVPIINMSGLGF